MGGCSLVEVPGRRGGAALVVLSWVWLRLGRWGFRWCCRAGWGTASVDFGGRGGIGYNADMMNTRQKIGTGVLLSMFLLAGLYGQFGAADKMLELAEDGLPEAQVEVGYMYESGDRMDQDYEAAAYWYRHAYEQGHGDGTYALATLYVQGRGVSKDARQAMALYTQAAEQGHQKSQYTLYMIYDRGLLVPEDKEKAEYWKGVSGH